jgi:hypothetical protein
VYPIGDTRAQLSFDIGSSPAYAVNVMLPKEAVRRNPSRVITEGAKRVVHEHDRTQIRRLLKEGA